MKLPAHELARCRDAVAPLAERWAVRARDERWAPHRWSGLEPKATLHLEDVSRIPFVSGVPGVQEYQHRARVRCGTGDVYVCVTDPPSGYEEYCRGALGLGDPHFVRAEALADQCAVGRAAAKNPALDALVGAVRERGGITIHPYMAIEDTWRLAEELAARSGTRVEVIGPTPEALWVANDKARFSDVVALTSGVDALVDTFTGTTIDEVARALGEFARLYPMVGIKRTRCASAMGNKVFASNRITGRSPDEVRTLVEVFLAETEWRGDEEVLVVEWVDTDLSPSTQLWIPPQGSPVCQGVYEQLLEGEEKCFLGSRPSTLPLALDAALAHASLQVAAGFQALGYVGRCSFDFVVRGDPNGDFSVMFTECNGRWGGTSTPMHLVDRLLGRSAHAADPAVRTSERGRIGERPPYVAQDWMEERLVGLPFERLHTTLESELYDPRTGAGRFVLYNVGPLRTRGKFDVIGFGIDPDDAWHGVRTVLPALLARI